MNVYLAKATLPLTFKRPEIIGISDKTLISIELLPEPTDPFL